MAKHAATFLAGQTGVVDASFWRDIVVPSTPNNG
jgi:hypothetical protein